ncbi:MAG: DEAD/DEAH box helicase [Parabacteroides sp.]
MSYLTDIETIGHLCLDDIIQTARKHVPEAYRYQPWAYPGLAHGTSCLESEEQLNCYLASYGEMHKGKLQRIMTDFPYSQLNADFEIIDWGCGQGIATVCFIDYLTKYNLVSKLQKVTLIEPSAVALERAKFNVAHTVHTDDVYIDMINSYLPSVTPNERALGGFQIEEPICIHLFSNILDIAAIDLKELAIMIGATGYRHYFLCVGPLNFGNNRIDAFCQYFNIGEKSLFSEVRNAQFGRIANGKWYSCVTKGFQLTREEGKPFLIPLTFYPPRQFHAVYRLDAIKALDDQATNRVNWNHYSAFEVLAPFDIGASIYEDIHPLLAVLSNLITRGLPTKCSHYIEEQLNSLFNYSERTERYGTITYTVSDRDNLIDHEDLLLKTPIGIARLQKVIVEALLTGRIALDARQWKVLVKEGDVPCAALAFEDLRQLFNHLSAMSTTYDTLQFPDIELHILSEKHTTSPLHLGNKTYKKVNQVLREQLYDMVIDIAIDEEIDAEHVQFSEFKAMNDCYFNVRSSKQNYSPREIYTTDTIDYKPVTTSNPSGDPIDIPEQKVHLTYFLNLLFRKSDFRPGQLPILNRALQNKGVIGLLPTGGGKSLTYQLAALLQPGITVIIDPLKSLMQDQYDGLLAAGIDCCTYINAELKAEERVQHEQLMESSQVLFTFMSPERLCIYEFRERLQNMHDLNVYFSYGVIDEVHCVSEWGQDFRFSYLHLGRNLYSYVRAKQRPITLFGLTATASFDVLADVERELSGNGAFELDPDTIVKYENSNRLELQYKIERVEVDYREDTSYKPDPLLEGYPRPVNIADSRTSQNHKHDCLPSLVTRIPQYLRELQTDDSLDRILTRFKERENIDLDDASVLKVEMPDNYYARKVKYEQAGIIFCPHVNSTGISVNVNADNLSRICEVGTFAGSPVAGQEIGNESMENMRKFRDNQMPLMVATKAFGMGIDKPNVRFTVNLNYSTSLESFVQEAGRAGRDRKMALAVILTSDYHLARISPKCKVNSPVLRSIKSKWFSEKDLRFILSSFGLVIEPKDIDLCNPLTDIVRLKCKTDNIINDKKQFWKCDEGCSKYRICTLRQVDTSMRGWQYQKDLFEYLRTNHIHIPKESYEYQGADYNTVMYFFDNNFKGEVEEKRKMLELLQAKEMYYFIGNDRKYKVDQQKAVKGFLATVLDAKVGTEVVTIIPYTADTHADIAKAIYRMCVIGLIDDFTQDYSKKTFRILATRKKNGQYYERLKQYLMRYYSEDRAENEVEKASVHKGQNEIHKCLGYLTEFIYDKIALKRKRAIDDMRNFCMVGIDASKDWKEINEDLKDEIYYYFNSKYAREGYQTEEGADFSLLDDTERGKKSSFDILYKYMRVVDADVIGLSGSPKDNVKHLQGAVRLIRRSETDTNPVLSLLNVFCLLTLKVGSNRTMQEELDASFIEGYSAFKERCQDHDEFFEGIDRFYAELNANNRNLASEEDLQHLSDLALEAELKGHLSWTENFINQYTN